MCYFCLFSNTLSGIDKYGVLISQSYPDDGENCQLYTCTNADWNHVIQPELREPSRPFREPCMMNPFLFSFPSSYLSPILSDVNFTGSTTSVSVGSSGKRLVVDCGNCSGNWDFSKLSITGGKSSSVDADDATVRLCHFVSDSHRSES